MIPNIKIIAAAVAILAISALVGKVYYAGGESTRIKQEGADNAARDKAIKIERDASPCINNTTCLLPDDFRAR